MKDDIPPLMRLAKRKAEKSKQSYKLGAVIAKGNKIISTGYNKKQINLKFGSGYNKTLHAEGDAIRNAIKNKKCLKGTTIYIWRKNDRLSKPCKCCHKHIKKYGIKKVVYSGANG